MTDLPRRHASTAAAAVVVDACLPAAAEAHQSQAGQNDRRLVQLRDRYIALEGIERRERVRLGGTHEIDRVSDCIAILQSQLIERMVTIPANTGGLKARAAVCEREHRLENFDLEGEPIGGGDGQTLAIAATLADVRRLAREG